MPPLSKDVAKKWRTNRYPVTQDVTQQEQQAGQHFYQRVFNRNWFFAILAFTADHKPTNDRKILPKEFEFVITRRTAT